MAPSAPCGCVVDGRVTQSSKVVNYLRLQHLIGDGCSGSCWNAADEGGAPTRGSDLDEEAWKAFGEWVEQLRVRSGLQVGEVAERADVSRVWLQEIRRGGRSGPDGWHLPNPRNEALVRLAHALKASPEEMLARAGRATSSTSVETKSQPAPPSDSEDASAAARIRELEELVAEQERQLARLRELLQRRTGRADVG
jgi:transcriptional regulator with XRE-family HTH domain